LNDLEPTSSAAAAEQPPNRFALAVKSFVRRLAARRPHPLSALDSIEPSELALVIALAVIGLAVRLVVLDPDTIHSDEALYASYGLHIVQTHDVFLHGNIGFPIDKIPLFYWAEAVVIGLLGNTPLSIRLVDLASAIVTIGAVYVLARDLSGRTAGWVAGLAMVLSPFAILFGASAFTDPFAIALGFGALALARRNHAVSAGILVGLALGGKLFGLAYLPLALLLLLTVDAPRRRPALVSFLVAFTITAGALLAFMAFRTIHYGVPWFLSTSIDEAGGAGLTNPALWSARLSAWWTWLGYFVESDPLRLAAAVGLLGACLAVLRNRGRLRWAIAAVCAFSPAYFVFLVLEKSPLYDRYLFYVLPTLCVAVGIGFGELFRIVRLRSARRVLLLACTVVVMAGSVPIVAQAESGAYPVGPRSDLTFSGYRQLCSWFQSSTTPLAIWNQSLSWPLAYCMSGYPDYLYWYPDVASIHASGPQDYLALSTRDDPENTVAALRKRGLTVIPVQTFDLGGAPHLWIYHVLPGPPRSTATP
jgi:4-amino-4-deoxy-L-arabinose transferase-like glycosyltransferase